MRPILVVVGSISCLCLAQAAAQTPDRHPPLIEFRLARLAEARGYAHAIRAADTTFYLADTALVSDDDIVDATTVTSARNGSLLQIRLTPSAASRLRSLTRHHRGERLGLLLNGEVNGAPVTILDTISATRWTTKILLSPASGHRFTAAVSARWPSGH